MKIEQESHEITFYTAVDCDQRKVIGRNFVKEVMLNFRHYNLLLLFMMWKALRAAFSSDFFFEIPLAFTSCLSLI